MIKRSTIVSQYELPIKIDQQKEGGYIARCSIWSDCYAQGDSVDEAILEVTAVAQSLIELYTEEDLPIPLERHNTKPIGSPFTIPVIVGA